MKKTNTQTNKKQTNKKKKHSKNNFFVTGMKRIIPDSRYNSSIHLKRILVKKQKQTCEKYLVKVAAK